MLREHVARFWDAFKQKTLFGFAEEIGPLTQTLEQLIRIWEVLRIEDEVRYYKAYNGRPPKDRKAIARAFVAKSFLKYQRPVHSSKDYMSIALCVDFADLIDAETSQVNQHFQEHLLNLQKLN
jgi:hypothetical protein